MATTTPVFILDILVSSREQKEKNFLLTKEHGLHTIAFPAISTGAYRYPKQEAAAIALKAVSGWLSANPDYGMAVIMVCRNYEMRQYYQNVIDAWYKSRGYEFMHVDIDHGYVWTKDGGATYSIEEDDLFDVQEKAIKSLKGKRILDFSAHDGLVEGLPYNLSFKIRKAE